MATRQRRAAPSPAQEDDDPALYARPASHEVVPLDADDVYEDDDDAQGPLDRVLIALREEADPSRRTRLALYRAAPKRVGEVEKFEWCEDYAPEELDSGGLPMIREKWGPGTYEVRAMGYKGDARHFTRIGVQRIILAAVPSPNVPALPAPAAGAAASELGAMFNTLAEGQRAMLAALTQRPDPMAEMQRTISLVASIRKAFEMGANAAPVVPQRSTIGEIVDAIKELRGAGELLGGGDGEKSDTDKILELVTPIMSMVGQAQQVQSQAVPQLTAPASFAGVPQLAARAPHAMPAASAPTAPTMPAPATPVADPAAMPAVSPRPAPTAEEQQVIQELHQHLQHLVGMAAASAPAETGAELVYEKLPDEMLDMLTMPIWWQALTHYAPQVSPYPQWFAQVRAIVLQWLAEDAQNPDSDGAGVGEDVAGAVAPTPSPPAG